MASVPTKVHWKESARVHFNLRTFLREVAYGWGRPAECKTMPGFSSPSKGEPPKLKDSWLDIVRRRGVELEVQK